MPRQVFIAANFKRKRWSIFKAVSYPDARERAARTIGECDIVISEAHLKKLNSLVSKHSKKQTD